MTVFPRTPVERADQRVELPMDWTAFEQFLVLRGESGATRLTYLDGRLELMSPSESHEAIKTRIGRLLEAWAEEFDVDLDGVGSWTVTDPTAKAGAEADESYLIPGREGASRPDLAIEVNWSTHGLDKLEAWRRLQVREVWVYDDGVLRVFVLPGDGSDYVEQQTSAVLPTLDVKLLAQFVGIRSQLVAVKSFRRALRETP
jgi:Uma2 family endonuclease